MSDTGDIKQQIERAFQDIAHNIGIAFAGSFEWNDIKDHSELSITYTPPLTQTNEDYNPQVRAIFESISSFTDHPWEHNKDMGIYDVTLEGNPEIPNGLKVVFHIDRANIEGALGTILTVRDYKWGEDFKERVDTDILKLLQSNVAPERILARVERLKQNWDDICQKKIPLQIKTSFLNLIQMKLLPILQLKAGLNSLS